MSFSWERSAPWGRRAAYSRRTQTSRPTPPRWRRLRRWERLRRRIVQRLRWSGRLTAHLQLHQRKRLHDSPSAAAFSSDGLRTYVTLSGGNDSPPAPNTIAFLKTKNQAEFGHVEVGNQSPGVQILRRIESLAVAPGPDGDVLYAAGQLSGTVWALDGGSGATLQEIEVGGGPIALLPDPGRNRVYVVADTTNELVAVDTTTRTITQHLSLPGRPSAGAVAPDGTVYIAGADAGQLWPISSDMTSIGQPILVGNQPSAVGVSLDGTRVYVAARGDHSLAVVDPSRRQITSRIEVGKDPVAIAVTHGRPAPSAAPAPTRWFA